MLINGLCKVGHNIAAIKLVKSMMHTNDQPNVIMFNFIINSISKERRLIEVMDLFSYMLTIGISPTILLTPQ